MAENFLKRAKKLRNVIITTKRTSYKLKYKLNFSDGTYMDFGLIAASIY